MRSSLILFALLTGCATRGSDAATTNTGGYGAPGSFFGYGDDSSDTTDDSGSSSDNEDSGSADDSGSDDSDDTGSADDSGSGRDSGTDSDSGADDSGSDSGTVDTDTGSEIVTEEDMYYYMRVGWTSSVSGSVDFWAVNMSCPSWSGYCVDGAETDVGTGSVYFDLDDLGCEFEWGDVIVVQGSWAGGSRWLIESASYADDGQHVDDIVIEEYYFDDDTLAYTASDLADDAYRVDHSSDPGGDLYIPTEDPTE